MIELAPHPRGVLLPVKAQAGARQNAVLGEHNGMLRVAVTAAPEKGKANKAIIEVLADGLKMPKSSIELAAGETSPQKRFLIAGADEEKLRTVLDRILTG
jgi:uncharacterized protein